MKTKLLLLTIGLLTCCFAFGENSVADGYMNFAKMREQSRQDGRFLEVVTATVKSGESSVTLKRSVAGAASVNTVTQSGLLAVKSVKVSKTACVIEFTEPASKSGTVRLLIVKP